MSEKHFSIDCDPDGLREVANRMGTLKDHLDTKAGTVKGTPGEIGGEWTGDAATSIKQEMTGLGTHMDGFADKLQPVIAGLRSLARDYDEALARLPGLNRKWNQAQTDYESAVSAADSRHRRTLDDLQKDGPVNGGIRNELDDIRSGQVSEASGARQTAQHNLEIDFGYMVQHLGTRTRALADILADSGPIPISSDQLANWRATGDAGLDHSGITATLKLTGDREAKELADELAALEAAARDAVKADVEDLNEALEDGDPETIQSALDAIGDQADDPIYAEALVDELGPDGVHDLYNRFDDLVADSTLFTEELWPHLKGLNDAIAHGLESSDGAEFADFMAEFNDKDYFQRQLALIAGSEYAGGKVCAAAMAYYSQVYNDDGRMGPKMYPEVFHYAYGVNDVHMMEDWDAKANGEDLAAFFQHFGEDDRKDLLDNLLVFSRNGSPPVGDEDWERLGRLYGEGLTSLRDQGNANIGREGGTFPTDAVQTMLEYVWSPAGSFDGDVYKQYVKDVVNDPRFLTWYIRDVVDDGASPRALNDAIKFAGGDADDLMKEIIDYQVGSGVDEDEIAEFVGYMLRTDELLGDEIKLGGVLKSLVESGISGTLKNPLTGPAMGVFNALFAEYERMEKDIQAWEDAMGDNRVHNTLGFALYIQIHGSPPEFDAWLTEHHRENDEDAMVDFLQEQKTDGTPLFREINNLVDIIDESRDEE